jgi:hypothetical protein
MDSCSQCEGAAERRIGGLHMVWWSFPIAEVISFAASVTFLVRIYQMIIKKIPNEE